MGESDKPIRISVGSTSIGWGSFWMFTIAVADLTVGQAAIALVTWPYYLGQWVSAVVS